MLESIYLISGAAELIEQYHIDQVLLFNGQPREIRQTGSCPAIVSHGKERWMDEFRWGLIPFWAPDSFWVDRDLFLDKRSFRRIVRRQRCVVPCNGFFMKHSGTKRGKEKLFRVRPNTGRTFGIAALYDIWRSKSTGEEVRTCTLLALPAGPLLSPFADRGPAVIAGEDIDEWLDLEISDPQRVVDRMGRFTNVKLEITEVTSKQSMQDGLEPEEGSIQTPVEFA